MSRLFYQKNLLFYLLIAFITFFVWHKVLNQTFLGEGYYYFNSKLYFTPTWKIDYIISSLNYDNFAKIFFQILSPFLKENILAYQLLALVITVVLLISFYKVLSEITNDKFLSFTAIVFLSTNYLALFEYLAAGNYQRFMQRIPNLIPTVISFYFLWKFIETKKYKFLFVCLGLYCLGLLMGHFSSLLLPPFVLYPLIQLVKEKINLRNLFLRAIISLVFIAITILLTKHGDQKPAYSFLEFFAREKNITERILYQIPVITFPLDTVEYIGKHLPTPVTNPYTEVYQFLLPFSLILYFGGAILIYKRLPKLFIPYLTFLLSMIAVMFLYMYVDTRLNVLKYFGEDRYFLPSLLFAVILWAMIIKALFLKSKNGYLIASTLLLGGSMLYNTGKIWSHIEAIQYKSEMNKKFINYFRENHNNFKAGSILVAPSYLSWPSPLITEIILKDKNAEFVLESHLLDKNLWDRKEKVYVYDYDYKNGELIDLTNHYRAGQKIKFLN